MHETFASSRLFEGLSENVKQEIYAAGEILPAKTDEVIIDEGAHNAQMYLLLKGRFKVSLPDRPDRLGAVTLGYRGPGDLLGEYSLLDGLPAAATVTSQAPGLLFRISHDALRSLLAASPEVSSVVYRNMLGYLVAQLRAQDQEFDSLLV